MKTLPKYFFLGLLSAFLFSLATPLSKILLGGMNEFFLAGLLYLGGAIGVVPVIAKKKETNFISKLRGPQNKEERKRVILSIVFGGIIGPVLLLFGLRSARAGSVSIWLNMELVATAILGAIFFEESSDKDEILGVVFMLASGIVITINEG